ETLIVESLDNEAGYVQRGKRPLQPRACDRPGQAADVFGGHQPETTEDLTLDQNCPKRTQFLLSWI
ncbi:MAG: hypothetical protein K9K79_03175, partial [Desulfohalobiaceae bacterium]|nr:hypothetical protein [Desulfohalobiaceae bacterium]